MAHQLTSIPGSSAVFMGSAVVYSNAAKHSLLGVGDDLLQQHGAVSEAVVQAMVGGALQQFGANYAIAVSGIMGPGGGTPEKPVGTVWMAAGNGEKLVTRVVRFRFDRQRNMELTANFAFNLLRGLMTGAV